tara:strand:- start:129 stop:290 length:162 start_codon:yes stop_codon:yes gene_type:complete
MALYEMLTKDNGLVFKTNADSLNEATDFFTNSKGLSTKEFNSLFKVKKSNEII